MKNVLCTICMRGGSKGIANKNILKINNKPLLYYTIKQAIKRRRMKIDPSFGKA